MRCPSLRVQRWLSYSYSRWEEFNVTFRHILSSVQDKPQRHQPRHNFSEVLAGEPFPGPFRAFHESLGGGAQVLAHMLLENCFEVTVAEVCNAKRRTKTTD